MGAGVGALVRLAMRLNKQNTLVELRYYSVNFLLKVRNYILFKNKIRLGLSY